MRTEISALILAGGESRRMGTDKALTVGKSGRPWIVEIADVARETTNQVWISTGGERRYENLFPADTRFVQDDQTDAGPLGGILTVLKRCQTPFVLCLTCDMPDVKVDHVRKLGVPREKEAAVYAESTFFPMVLRADQSVMDEIETRTRDERLSVGEFLTGIHARAVRLSREPIPNRNELSST